MFETMLDRAGRRARARAEARRRDVADRLAAELPSGIRVDSAEEGVRLAGRDLRRRSALEPELRWKIAEALK